MEKPLNNVTKKQLIEKLKNMDSFIVICAAANGMSENYIKNNYTCIEYTGEMNFKVDDQFGVSVCTASCCVYRDNKGKILMIESKNFIVQG